MKTFTVEEAKEQFSEVVALAAQGELISIVGGAETLVLRKPLFDDERDQAPLFAEPIPMAPPGYFDDIYDEEYVRECNECGKHSVIEIPRDLE